MTDPMNLVPRYYQIVSWLNAQIASAAFVPGQRIPTERELGERFGVARETVRRATALLRQEGTLEGGWAKARMWLRADPQRSGWA
jgi:DNA-binding GntR family transcriptional regulator